MVAGMALAEILIAPTKRRAPNWEEARAFVASLAASTIDGDEAFDDRLISLTKLHRARAQGMRDIELERQWRIQVKEDIDAIAGMIEAGGGTEIIWLTGGAKRKAERACVPLAGARGAYLMRGHQRPTRGEDYLAPYWRDRRLIASGALSAGGYAPADN